MKMNLFLLLLVCVAVFALTFFLDRKHIPASSEIKQPVPAAQDITGRPVSPDPLLTPLEGDPVRLHDFEGRIVLLNFWASWCAPCVKEFPQLLELAEQRLEKDLILIAVSVDFDEENIHRFFNRLDAESQKRLDLRNVLIVHDPQKEIAQDVFQTVRYPETLIIGPDLTLRRKIIGASIDFTSSEFAASLDEILGTGE